jgi:hypothetical protein
MAKSQIRNITSIRTSLLLRRLVTVFSSRKMICGSHIGIRTRFLQALWYSLTTYLIIVLYFPNARGQYIKPVWSHSVGRRPRHADPAGMARAVTLRAGTAFSLFIVQSERWLSCWLKCQRIVFGFPAVAEIVLTIHPSCCPAETEGRAAAL